MPRPVALPPPGTRFRRWVVIGTSVERLGVYVAVSCRCDCGTVKLVNVSNLRTGKSDGCGCAREYATPRTGRPVESRIGETYARLTVLRIVERRVNGTTRVLCACACGGTSTPLLHNVIKGLTRSCGCLNREARQRQRDNAKGPHPLRSTWNAMLLRCYDPTDAAFPNYGGRGIVVCRRWRESFDAFCADMGPKPGVGYSIDRVNNDGPYSPDNCRWATQREQARNTRRNVWLEYGGRRMLAIDWASELGISRQRMEQRLRAAEAYGWPPDRVFAPRNSNLIGPKLYELNGEQLTVVALAKFAGLGVSTVARRLATGRTPAEAILSPGRYRWLLRRLRRNGTVSRAPEKRPRHCSLCSQPGHYRTRCPQSEAA